MKKKLADEAETERRRQEVLKGQDSYWRPPMEQAQAEQHLTQTHQVGHSCGLLELHHSLVPHAASSVLAPNEMRCPPLSDGLTLHQGVRD